MDGQGTKRRRNIAENFNCLSRAHERFRQTDARQTTDGRAIAYSERKREFTFDNKLLPPYPPHIKNVTALPCKMLNFSSD